MRGSDPYGSPFGTPLLSLFCYFGISLRLPNYAEEQYHCEDPERVQRNRGDIHPGDDAVAELVNPSAAGCCWLLPGAAYNLDNNIQQERAASRPSHPDRASEAC